MRLGVSDGRPTDSLFVVVLPVSCLSHEFDGNFTHAVLGSHLVAKAVGPLAYPTPSLGILRPTDYQFHDFFHVFVNFESLGGHAFIFGGISRWVKVAQ